MSSSTQGRLTGKTAVVTGGNSGIGRAASTAFAREGAQAAIFGRDKKTLDEALGELGSGGHAVQGDVTNQEDLDRLYGETRERYGQVDVLFANAGIAQVAPLAEVDEAFFDRHFDVNVKGLFFTVQKALPLLSEGASVILTGSVGARLGMAGMSVYTATKGAVRTLARAFSAELAERGIRVNSLSPGPIETPIYGRLELPEETVQEMGQGMLSRVAAGRFGSAEEVAKAALFLASTESSYMLGSDLVVDGGMSEL